MLPIMPHFDADTVERIRAFDRWDLARRRQAGLLAGLSFHKSRGRVSLYRHWPHLLCWQWGLHLEIGRTKGMKSGFWKQGPGAAGGLHTGFRIPKVGAIIFHRQASDRIAQFGEPRRSAPIVFLPTPEDGEGWMATEARRKAWETRRQKYGAVGHSGSYSRLPTAHRGALWLVIALHREGVLSEGQVAQATGLDRIAIRRMADALNPKPEGEG